MNPNKVYVHQKLDIDQQLINSVLREWRENHREEYYDISTIREKLSPALKHTRTYHLRRPDVSGVAITRTESTQHILKMVDTPLLDKFPLMQGLITFVGNTLFGGWTELGRIFVTRLEGKQSIGRHIDEGDYFDRLHRFHLVLESTGSNFCWDQQKVQLNQGEIWKLNNSIPHWVENDGISRTHVIFDAH